MTVIPLAAPAARAAGAVRPEARTGTGSLLAVAVTGSLDSPSGRAGTFTGAFRLERFVSRFGKLAAVGVVTGELTDADGSRIGVGSRRQTAVLEAVANGDALVVRLGPLVVDLLGIVVSVHETSIIEFHGAAGRQALRLRTDGYSSWLSRMIEIGMWSTITPDVIEQAKGVVVGLAHCTADEACAELMLASEEHNVSLYDIAGAVVDQASDVLVGEALPQALDAIVRARWGDLSSD